MVTRTRRPAHELTRLQLDEAGALVVGGRPGRRSAWVTPDAAVVAKLMAKPGMARRSLRAMPRSTAGLLESMRSRSHSRVERALIAAWRSGCLRLQSPPTPGIVLVPSDTDTAPDHVRLPWTAAGLGQILNRPPVPRLVALPCRPVRRLLLQLQQHARLG